MKPAAQFEELISVSVGDITGCWNWAGSVGKHGYGTFKEKVDGGRRITHAAHRWSYAAFVRPIPPGLQIDHLCHNRLCVNPWHLEPVTQQENIRRGLGQLHQTSRTECKRGHSYAAEDVITRTGRSGNQVRTCRTCRNESRRSARKATK